MKVDAQSHDISQQHEYLVWTEESTPSQHRCANSSVASRGSPNRLRQTIDHDSQVFTTELFRQTFHSSDSPTIPHKFCTIVVGPWTVVSAAAALDTFRTCTLFCASTKLMPTVVTEFSIPLSLSTLRIANGRVVYMLLLTPGGSSIDFFNLCQTIIIVLAMLALLFLFYFSFATSQTVLPCCSCRCKTNP